VKENESICSLAILLAEMLAYPASEEAYRSGENAASLAAIGWRLLCCCRGYLFEEEMKRKLTSGLI